MPAVLSAIASALVMAAITVVVIAAIPADVKAAICAVFRETKSAVDIPAIILVGKVEIWRVVRLESAMWVGSAEIRLNMAKFFCPAGTMPATS
jgi:hypothetical protein